MPPDFGRQCHIARLAARFLQINKFNACRLSIQLAKLKFHLTKFDEVYLVIIIVPTYY
jgi:hypothetical protein